MARETIAARSSPPGPALRGVIRVSGPMAWELVQRTVIAEGLERGRRGSALGRFDDGRGRQPVLVLWMPAPASFTREDVAELHLPGAPPLLEAALARLVVLGARPAEAGEFTRRAFENGRIDLTRAEGVLALVAASNEIERRSAAALLFGGLAERVEALRGTLEELRALCEASLDFDESDTGHVPAAELERLAAEALDGLREALGWEERREPLSALPRVALVGAPNAGKSSLFNRLVAGLEGQGRALVSDLAGTTRDGVSALWELPGGCARLIDTPGLDELARASGDPDAQAQQLAREELSSSDLLLWVVDASRAEPESLARAAEELPTGPARLLVWNQVDRPGTGATPPSSGPVPGPVRWCATSARTGEGLEDLRQAAAAALGLGGEGAPATETLGPELGLRHRTALEASHGELEAALEQLRSRTPLDLVAESLRAATAALDGITGRTTPEDLLDRIFSRFCLGK